MDTDEVALRERERARVIAQVLGILARVTFAIGVIVMLVLTSMLKSEVGTQCSPGTRDHPAGDEAMFGAVCWGVFLMFAAPSLWLTSAKRGIVLCGFGLALEIFSVVVALCLLFFAMIAHAC